MNSNRKAAAVAGWLYVLGFVSGILSVVLASLDLMAVSGLGLIIWFVWLGIVLLRNNPSWAA